MKKTKLGINIDHFATIRNKRNTKYPNLLKAALIAEKNGANNITIHLRKDKRHIKDKDLKILENNTKSKINLKISIKKKMINIAYKIKPYSCYLVPEKREELTTENSLNVKKQEKKIFKIIKKLKKNKIKVALFIDPDIEQINASIIANTKIIEINTGSYSDEKNKITKKKKLQNIINAAKYATNKGLIVHAGHELNYNNVKKIASIKEIKKLNIGHAIINKLMFIGFKKAIQKIKKLIK
ncbi:pyridoxine 5'-phosphate synthase [Candidatus Purcelliella pentastirinorum]|uniref:Pyridoxine 5'-phosphate synthase n=1 Tax=Candidatus Purcelliella pentastirinorum TaxID=472834 RepID=A0AAX3NA89_9ENTR|nr:pyridoxine 5'-phosphate synthase [Candidatus Purcelliella pentastirinorum]WDI78418.1 pyridoxine 5'-phosphate synthase [Candidatus Purcelliella pentastirinorum]